jgi:hypothetical protein
MKFWVEVNLCPFSVNWYRLNRMLFSQEDDIEDDQVFLSRDLSPHISLWLLMLLSLDYLQYDTFKRQLSTRLPQYQRQSLGVARKVSSLQRRKLCIYTQYKILGRFVIDLFVTCETCVHIKNMTVQIFTRRSMSSCDVANCYGVPEGTIRHQKRRSSMAIGSRRPCLLSIDEGAILHSYYSI